VTWIKEFDLNGPNSRAIFCISNQSISDPESSGVNAAAGDDDDESNNLPL
jgi:hypothetical protein